LPPGRYVKVAVRDTGVGMNRETQARCFAPFFTTKGIGNALGMGLAYAYGVVKNHGGFIKVESRIRKGATFTIFLPSSTMRA
ncbi:MAG: histidine kinase, partial [Deltaproteobacteria bacterium]|nr:histidine kinase [Deltaproteobacteria bacterium]